MNRQSFTRVITLMAVPCLAVVGLLLVFLLLGWNTVDATLDRNDTVPKVQFQDDTFTVSGTVACEATGPISDVEVYAWNRDQGTGFVGDVTDISGTYSVTLKENNYDLIFNPPCGSGCASQALKGIVGPSDQTRNVPLTSGHTVSGTVFITDGTTPISNVVIYAFNHNTADGFGLPPTDDNGYYCIGLLTGTYDLGFTPTQHAVREASQGIYHVGKNLPARHLEELAFRKVTNCKTLEHLGWRNTRWAATFIVYFFIRGTLAPTIPIYHRAPGNFQGGNKCQNPTSGKTRPCSAWG